MAAKWFIAEPGNERVFATVHAALANESDVEILSDRRRRGLRGVHWHRPERRVAQDVRDRHSGRWIRCCSSGATTTGGA